MAVAHWLLCIWQARAIQASWWSVLVMMLSLLGLETIVAPPRRALVHGGWPELVRAWITLAFMYFACMLLFGGLWNGGRALGTVLLVLAGWALLMSPSQWEITSNAFLPADVLGIGVAIAASCISHENDEDAASSMIHMSKNWIGWLHLVALLHLLLVSNNNDNKNEQNKMMSGIMIITWWRLISAVIGIPLILGLYPEPNLVNDAPWLLLALPSIAMQMQKLVKEFITPLVQTLCHPGLYTLLVSLFSYYFFSLFLVFAKFYSLGP